MKLEQGNITDSLVVWLNKYIEDGQVKGYQKGTIELYSRVINNFIDYANGYMDEYSIKGINRLFINGYLSKRGQSLRKSTESTHLRIIKAFFNFISDNNSESYDFRHIFKKIKVKVPKRQHPYLTENQVSRLLNTIEKEKSKRHSYIAFRNAMLVKLMLYSGARVSEAINVRYGDISSSDIDSSFYKIIIIGKGDKEAPIYIKKDLIEEEFRYMDSIKHYKNIDYVFTAFTGKPIDRINVYTIIKRLLRISDINKTGVHILRHTLAMRLAARNVDILHIQKIMRHSNIQTTMIYAHSTETDSLKALEKLDER